jgi:DNA-binding transcriptional regulator YdaS (Cro superfamily)
MVELRNWLFKNATTQSDFARSIGIHPNYFSNLLCGRFNLTVKVAKLIEDGTRGEVKAADLLGLKT